MQYNSDLAATKGPNFQESPKFEGVPKLEEDLQLKGKYR